MTKFDAYHKMKELLTNYYIEAKTTKVKPIAWITSGAPVEFLYAMDILPIYPENYAAMCAANHQSIELMESAEAEYRPVIMSVPAGPEVPTQTPMLAGTLR